MSRVAAASAALLFAISFFPRIVESADAPQSDRRRPNVVFVLVDDLRWDELGCTGHPYVQTPHVDRLAKEGSLFRNAFTVAPLCSPSRGAFLTGRYPHANGIVDNTNRSRQSHQLVTFPRLLHEAGYKTAFFGKWHMGNDDSPRPGFDEWLCLKGQGEAIDPPLNSNGESKVVRGYVTDILTDRSVEFIRQCGDKPFCLYLAQKALHPNLRQRDDGSIATIGGGGFVAAERHRQLYKGAKVPHRPNYQQPPAGKPALDRSIDNLPPLSADTVTDDETIRDRQRMLAAVDEGLGKMLDALKETGVAEDTIVVFTSDHGYFYGEHGLSVERRLAYEEAIRIPLLIRYPRVIGAKTVIDFTTLSIDLAPTLLQYAGASIPANMSGRSLVPVLLGQEVPLRESFLIEYFSDTVFPRIRKMGYQAVRTDRWKHIHYTDLPAGMDELYDLQSDPYEMRNVIGEPANAAVIKELSAERKRMLEETKP
jgi:N-acetylglucosamine-6-sulfatase